jgi:uncharacterized repeat protein (TIGR03837 family)
MPQPTPVLWNIFCRVIDNHGDLGVCWRLARQLAAEHGQRVRLWVDDARALDWMAPGARQGRVDGVQVLPWTDPIAPDLLATLPHADVWVEAFGCEIAPEFIASSAHQSCAGSQNDAEKSAPVWINLEYLSAEPWVERMHALPSPVQQGPAAGWTKWFFYPGFTPRTGGLLREAALPARQAAFDRAGWRRAHGVAEADALAVALFCYEPPALGDWLAQLQASPNAARLLVTAGRAQAAVQAALQANSSSQTGRQRPSGARGQLSISYLPYLTQTDFDHLLWACDLNCVRGEDSLVRALWAGAPLLWQLYPQHDNAHHAKLDAFLRWLDAPPSLAAWHRIWNGAQPGPLPRIDWRRDLADWSACVQAARQRLLAQHDLATQLIRFVDEKRYNSRLCEKRPAPV